MTYEANTCSEPKGLREAIREYANQIVFLLRENIGVISANEGIPRSLYQETFLKQHDPAESTDWNVRKQTPRGNPERVHSVQRRRGDFREPNSVLDDEQTSGRLHTLSEIVGERGLYDDWKSTGFSKPLLIVGPAGSGKSCLVESFALWMSEDILRSFADTQPYQTPLAIPLIISLQRLEGKTLGEYFASEDSSTSDVFPRALTTEMLAFLQKEKSLVLLLDGFDEAPHLKHAIANQVNSFGGRYVLTSRPGHGETSIISNLDRQRAIREFSLEQGIRFVESFFSINPCRRIQSEGILEGFLSSWNSPIGRLIRRPLYLKSWCDFVHEADNYSGVLHFPSSLNELGQLLFKKTLHSRRVFDHITSECLRMIAIEEFATWYGRIGKYFADTGFKGVDSNIFRATGLLEHHPPETPGHDSHFYEQVAIQCGLLIFAQNLSKYYVPTSPLAEYLVGRYLASDAEQHPNSPTLLIKTFQSWIWRTDLHDILDFTFDAIWHSPRKETSRWGDLLLSWLDRSSREGDLRLSTDLNNDEDDLICPFVYSSLRWGLLSPRKAAAIDLTPVIDATRVSARVCPSLLSFPAEVLRMKYTARTLLKSIIDDYAYNDLLTEEERVNLRQAITEFSGTVSEEDSLASFGEYVSLLSHARGNFKYEEALSLAIRSVARRVPPQEIELLFSKCSAARIAFRGEYRIERLFLEVIRIGASRITREFAGPFILHWLKLHEVDYWLLGRREHWQMLISGAACQVLEDDAENVVTELMGNYSFLIGDQRGWLDAIEAAAAQFLPLSAMKHLLKWCNQAEKEDRDSNTSAVLHSAIAGAGRNVPTGHAFSLICELTTVYLKRLRTHSHPSVAWLLAVKSVANCVEPKRASEAVSYLCDVYHDLRDSSEKVYLLEAIEAASANLTDADASGLVIQWSDQYDSARQSSIERSDLLRAIAGATRNLRGLHSIALMNRLMDIYSECRRDKRLEREIRSVLQKAATGVEDDSIDESDIDQVTDVCDRAMYLGLESIAFLVSKNVIQVTVVKTTTRGAHEKPSRVYLRMAIRSSLIFDSQFAHAPEEIRTVGTRFPAVDLSPSKSDWISEVLPPERVSLNSNEKLRNQNHSGSILSESAIIVLPEHKGQKKKALKHLRSFYVVGIRVHKDPPDSGRQISDYLSTQDPDGHFPLGITVSETAVNVWINKVYHPFFRQVFEGMFDEKSSPFELFLYEIHPGKEKERRFNYKLSPTGLHVWKLTRACLISQNLLPNIED